MLVRSPGAQSFNARPWAGSNAEHDLIRSQILKEEMKKERGNWPGSEDFKVISAQGSLPFLPKPPGDLPRVADPEHPLRLLLFCAIGKPSSFLHPSPDKLRPFRAK